MPPIQPTDSAHGANHGASRAISLALVALLHALLLFAILHFMVVTPKIVTTRAPEHLLEMIINTARKPVPVTVPAPLKRAAPSRPRPGGVSSGAMPSYAPPVAPPMSPGLARPCSAVRRKTCPI